MRPAHPGLHVVHDPGPGEAYQPQLIAVDLMSAYERQGKADRKINRSPAIIKRMAAHIDKDVSRQRALGLIFPHHGHACPRR